MERQLKILLLLFALKQFTGLATVLAFDEIPDKIIKQAPIIIQTPEANYDQPNLDDYKSCMRNFDKCVKACDEKEKNCLDQCPKCPELVNEDVIVQGINDTDYKPAVSNTLNSTNVIRLTNEIHNIIDNNLGNVLAKNQNNINVYQENNATTSKSVNKTCNNKYGMGCNERGPCCTVISKGQRQKHCGERCQARVMYARSVVQCTDDNDLNSCGHVVEYKPYRPRRVQRTPPNRCHYQQNWPYVSCQNKRSEETCSQKCLELAYGYILQHGVPLQCINCYKNLNTAQISASPVGYAPAQLEGYMPDDLTAEGWALEDEKPWP